MPLKTTSVVMPQSRSVALSRWSKVLAILGVITFGALPLLILFPAPLADWPSHLARVWVSYRVLHGDPFWSLRYEFRSLLIPNAALDGVLLGLMALGVPLALAAPIFLLLSYGLFVSGFLRLSRLGMLPPLLGSCVAVALFYTGNLIYGLLNFVTGIGLVLWVVSFWFSERATIGRRLALAMVFTPIILFCHILAAGVFVCLTACYDFFRPARDWRQRALQLAPATLIFLESVLSYVFSATVGDDNIISYDGQPSPLDILIGKVRAVALALTSGNQLVDMLLIAMLATVAILLWQRHQHCTWRMAAPVVGLALLPLVLPFGIGSGKMLDVRMVIVAVAIGLAMLPWATKLDQRVELCLILVCLVRTGLIVVAWASYKPAYDQMRAAVAEIPVGSTLLDAYSDQPSFYRQYQPPLWNIAAIAVFDGVFVPSMWAEPSQQPLVVRQERRPLWLWSHSANARTSANLASVRARAHRYCSIDSHTHLLIMHVSDSTPFTIEDPCGTP